MRRGHSLWELSCGVVLAALLAVMGFISVGRSVDLARGQHARRDMAAILSAARQYEVFHGIWPVTWPQMEEVLPWVERNNPWGAAYVMGADVNHFWVETKMPQDGVVRTFTGRMYGASARLVYEQRYVYEKE